jgi:hypothetical protein
MTVIQQDLSKGATILVVDDTPDKSIVLAQYGDG